MRAPVKRDTFVWTHAVVIPAAFVFAAIGARRSGLDDAVTRWFFDPVARDFAARHWPVLEAIGHRTAKSAVLALWIVLAGAALAATCVRRLAPHRALLWSTVAAMALGPTTVVLLKDINSLRCPWDLERFGGLADPTAAWFVPAAEAGHCFPAGHAAGGFCLVALAFAGLAIGNRRLWLGGLVAALAAGTVFSAVRVTQGAHFVSHNLWSAAIDWCFAALVFAPRLRGVAPASVAASTKAGA